MPDVFPGQIFNSDVYLFAEMIEHHRRIYGLLDLLGDLGGVLEILAVSLGFTILPLSKHLFILEATKLIFMARTKDSSVFDKKADCNTEVNPTEKTLEREPADHTYHR